VSGLIAGLEPLDREVLTKSDLKVVSRCGSGLSNIDLAAAKELGIIIKNTPQGPVTAVAELTVGCLLSLLRHVPQMDADLHQKKWTKMMGKQLSDMQVAVIGYGNIGKKVGALLSAFGAKVIPVDPQLPNSVDLGSALKQADVVSLHCSGEDCLLGKDRINLMKKGTYLLNAARGSLVDEAALVEALKKGQIAGAWIDAFQQEPYAGPLTQFTQVILTPHVGSYTLECRRQMEMESVDNLISGLIKGA
jgi:D-3-phosphoglycerate dehydrogenase